MGVAGVRHDHGHDARSDLRAGLGLHVDHGASLSPVGRDEVRALASQTLCRYVWRIYLDRGEFSKALKLTSTLSDPAPHQMVLKRKAEQFISEKK